MLEKYLWVFVEKFSVVIVKFISIMILARFILPKDFGVFAIANYIIVTCTLFIDSGMAGALIRKKNTKIIDYSTINIFCLIMSIVVGVGVFAFAPLIANFYNMLELQVIIQTLCFSLFFRALTVVYLAKLSKEMLFRRQAIIYSMAAIISSIIAICFAYLNYGYWALVIQQIIEAILIFIFLKAGTKDFSLNNEFSFVVLKEHFSFGIKLTFSSVIEALSTNLIIHQITKIGGAIEVGKYTQTSRINEIFLGVITTTIDKAALPIFVKKSEDFRDVIELSTKLLAISSLIAYYIISNIILSADSIVRVVLGPNWVDSAWMLQIICYCSFSQIIEIILRSILKSQGKSDVILYYSFFKLLVLVVSLSLIYYFFKDVEYLLFGLVFLSIFNILVYLFLFEKIFNLRAMVFIKSFYKPLFSALVSILMVSFFWERRGAEDLLYSLIDIFFNALLVAFIYFFTLKVIKFSELHYIENLFSSILRKIKG